MALGEFELIRRFFEQPAKRALLGIGDDCALLAAPARHAALAVTTDMLVCDRHFLADAPPASIGHKALAVNLSDLAAMGAAPVGFTLALALPQVDEAWLAEFSAGLLALASATGCELLGGDTTRGPLTISITAIGEVPPGAALRRDAAQAGDDVWVSGSLGAAALAVREALAGRPLPEAHPARCRMERPQARLSLGLALRSLAHAAIDVSDGLISDLGHVCDRSRLGAHIDWNAVPVDASLAALSEDERKTLALSGGDDYELLFTAKPSRRDAIQALRDRLGLAVTRIGQISDQPGIRITGADARAVVLERGGFDHFA
ncbi:MAG: thiamine-phosphate kinase [Betaproteobacteria bacterium]|nr:thiamine-phosphate kinase [Betaproteobacteria bacterium]